MKKENFGNSRKCLGQKNQDASNFEIPEISLAQLILEQFAVNKEMYKYKGNIYNYVGAGKFKDSTGKWIDAIIYERDNHIYMREVTDFIDKFKKA